VSTFPRSAYDLGELLTTLGIGEAVVTVLSENGAPTPVAWTRLRPPQSLMAQLDPAQQTSMVTSSPVARRYAQPVDDASAYEKLRAREQALQQPSEQPAEQGTERPPAAAERGTVAGIFASPVFRSFARSAASAAGREITRSLFGTAPRRRRRRGFL